MRLRTSLHRDSAWIQNAFIHQPRRAGRAPNALSRPRAYIKYICPPFVTSDVEQPGPNHRALEPDTVNVDIGIPRPGISGLDQSGERPEEVRGRLHVFVCRVCLPRWLSELAVLTHSFGRLVLEIYGKVFRRGEGLQAVVEGIR